MTRPVALITGATRGIGAAIAHALAPTHHLVLGGTQPDRVAAACARYGDALPFVADLRDSTQLEAQIAQLDRLDVLIHNAGIATFARVENATYSDWREIFDINVIAVAELTRLCLPLLRAAHGQVITLNSGAGFAAGAGDGLYAASKHALKAFTDALREEERGIVRVTSIHPGRVDTEMQRQMWQERGRDYHGSDHLTPADVAATVKLAIEISPTANIDMLSVRPAVPVALEPVPSLKDEIQDA
ncbi:MAG: SDR family oxidoreductase, partial [Propionibacteriaceae bacterium]